MTLFWVLTLILVAIACVFVAIPMLKPKANNDAALRDDLNKAFYKDRLAELAVETDEGLVEDQQELVADLKQSLLDDIPNDQNKTEERTLSMSMVLVPSLILVVALSYGLYAVFGNYQKVQHWQEISQNLPELSKKLMNPQGVELTDKEMEDLTLALRTRLHYEPEDSTGWLLLGRIGLANRDMETAIGAMKKAYAIEPQDGDIKLGYAQALMLSNDQIDQQSARTLLNKMLKAEYVDLRVYSLLAFDAFERQDYPTAIEHWQSMQQMIGPDDGRYEMLSRSIASAKAKMEPAVLDEHAVSVSISLGSEVVLPNQGVVIVSVHSADGAPMPIAAARYPLGNFPFTVIMDDSNSMMQGRKLSDLQQLIVRVRIDSDGNVATRDGDWFGESQVVELGSEVKVEINKQF